MIMGFFVLCLLRTFHSIYTFLLFVSSLCEHPTPSIAQKCRRIPKHIALVLVPQVDLESQYLIQSIINAVAWCRSVEIEKLTIYDEHGASAAYPFPPHK